MKQNHVVSVRDQRYFVCDYTGGPTKVRFFLPVKGQKAKDGCFASLPILMRYVFETHGCRETEDFLKAKHEIEEFYKQPDIPIAPALDSSRIPLSASEMKSYMDMIPKGSVWQRVEGSLSIDSQSDQKTRYPSRKRGERDE